jgi:hypothetical protein
LSPEKDHPLWPITLLGALFAAFTFSRSAAYKYNNPAKAIHPQQRTDREDNHKHNPVCSYVPPTITKCEYAERGKEAAPNWKKFAEIIVAISTFGLLLVNVFLLPSTKKAADSAQKTADFTARTMRVDQRAWIAPRVVNQIVAQDQPLAVTIQFDNTGKTPATHVETCVVAEIIKNTTTNIDVSCPDTSKSPGLSVVFPQTHISRLIDATGNGGKTTIDPQGLLREPLMKQLRHWEKSVLVYGRIDYWDVFKRPHWATFCSTMLILPPTPGGMPETVNWNACPAWNDIDPDEE